MSFFIISQKTEGASAPKAPPPCLRPCKESSSETENFQNTVTAKPDAVTVDDVEAQPVDLDRPW